LRLAQRARIIAYILEDNTLYASEAGQKVGYASVVTRPVWMRRFNEQGLAGLEDQPRPGRQPTHAQAVHSQLISWAIQKPRTLGYPFALWALERLQTAFEKRHGIHLSDSTIWE
jgi:transposase